MAAFYKFRSMVNLDITTNINSIPYLSYMSGYEPKQKTESPSLDSPLRREKPPSALESNQRGLQASTSEFRRSGHEFSREKYIAPRNASQRPQMQHRYSLRFIFFCIPPLSFVSVANGLTESISFLISIPKIST